MVGGEFRSACVALDFRYNDVMRLMREIRCFAADGNATCLNSWAGSSDRNAVAPFWILRAVVDGPVAPQTGYLCDIKDIDAVLRTEVLPQLVAEKSAEPGIAAIALRLAGAASTAAARLPSPTKLISLELSLSPYTKLAVSTGALEMIELTHAYEFSAAHRLSCEDLSDEENRRVFGKCSNPKGHGHNYVLEVTVAGPLDEATGTVTDLAYLDRIVRERVVEPFDHKHLNVELAEFATLNPTVENIALVVWNRLVAALDRCRLAKVRVWETPKTYAEYSGRG